MSEQIEGQRKGKIKGAWISYFAKLQNEGHVRIAGLVDDLVKKIADAENYVQLETAIREFHKEARCR
jgi:hypothetical protein